MIEHYKSGSDNPPNAASDITKVCTICGGEFEYARGIVSRLGQNGSWSIWIEFVQKQQMPLTKQSPLEA